jgi:hypothetical protein
LHCNETVKSDDRDIDQNHGTIPLEKGGIGNWLSTPERILSAHVESRAVIFFLAQGVTSPLPSKFRSGRSDLSPKRGCGRFCLLAKVQVAIMVEIAREILSKDLVA